MNTGLSYKVVESQRTITKTVELKISKDWGMFTSGGNRSLRLKAEKLVEQVKSTDSLVKRLEYFTEYFRGYRSLSNTKTMRESSDTMVREMVWGFAMNLGKCVGISYETLDNVWNSKDSYPKKKV